MRNPSLANYQLGDGLTLTGCSNILSDSLTLTGRSHTLSESSPTMLITRQQQFDLRYQTEIQISGTGLAGLTIFHTNEHHYDLCVQAREDVVAVWLRRQVADMFMESVPVFFESSKKLTLRVEANKLMYTFYAGTGDDLVKIGTGSSQLLSTEVMRCTFTGCFAGIFAEGETEARFSYFSAEALK